MNKLERAAQLRKLISKIPWGEFQKRGRIHLPEPNFPRIPQWWKRETPMVCFTYTTETQFDVLYDVIKAEGMTICIRRHKTYSTRYIRQMPTVFPIWW